MGQNRERWCQKQRQSRSLSYLPVTNKCPAARWEIWQKVFPTPASVEALDFNALSRLEITGANIRNIAVNAAFLAASEGTSIRMEHAMRAARREYTKIDRLIMDSEFGRYATGRPQ